MAKWKGDRLKLAKDHAWRAKPGYQIVVLDRGAVRFDVPQGWVIGPGEGAVELRDRPSPDDLCLIQASVLYAPPGIDWQGLPLARSPSPGASGSGRPRGPAPRSGSPAWPSKHGPWRA